MDTNSKTQEKERPAPKRDIAKHVIRQYLEDLYNISHGQLLEIPKSDLNICKNYDRLIEHVYVLLESQEDILNPEKYDRKDYPNKTFISRNIIRYAIKELVNDCTIYYDKDNRCFRYTPSEQQISNQFPILKIAQNITITPLPYSTVVYFHVSPIYADAVVDYLNAQFKPDDVRAINLGEIIMCIEFKTYDIQVKYDTPYDQTNASQAALFIRICKILKKFNLASLAHTPITNPNTFFKTHFEKSREGLQGSPAENVDE